MDGVVESETEGVFVVREMLEVSVGLPSTVFVEDRERLLDLVRVWDPERLGV